MAKGKVNKNQVVENNLFDDLKKSAADAAQEVVILEQSMDALVKTAVKIKKGLAGNKVVDVKTMKEFNQLTKEAEAASKSKLALDKQLNAARDKEVKARLRLKKVAADQRKILKNEIELEQAQVGSLKRVREESKKLRIEKENVNRFTKAGAKRIQEINAQLDRNNRILEKNATKLGKQKIGIGRYEKAVNGLRGALVKLGLGFGVFQVIKNAFTTIKDFEQGQADLASVLGVNTSEMEELTKQAKELGATTTFTATQVSELQKEFAKLGFTQKEIQDVTESTLLLAEATGSELARAAEVAGATIRGFGLETSETQRVVDVMAKSFSSSSLDMEKFANSMSAVAPVAAQFGFNIEETTGLIGTLTDRGIDASTAGTGLRNMFLDANKAGLTFQEALDAVNNATDKTAKSFELFGKRGATLGVILATNQDSAQKLAGTLEIAGGKITADDFFQDAEEAGLDFDKAMKKIAKSTDKHATATEIFGEKMADFTVGMAEAGKTSQDLEAELEKQRNAAEKMALTQRDTLGGALALLQSAWDGFVLSMNEAGGVGEKIRGVIVFLADNLNTILAVLGKVIKAFVIYKATLLALKLRDRAKEFIDYNKQVKQGAQGLARATPTVKAFGAALKGIGLGIAITLLVELGQAIWDYASGAAAARRQQELFNQAVEDANTKLESFRDKMSKSFQKRINEINKERAARNISEKEAVEQRKKAIQDQQAILKGKIAEVRAIYQKLNALKAEAKADADQKQAAITTFGVKGLVATPSQIVEAELAAEKVRQINAAQREQRLIIEGLREDYNGLNQSIVETEIEITEMDSTTKESGKTVKKINTEFKNQIDLLKELNEELGTFAGIMDEINQVEIEGRISALNREIEEVTETLQFMADEGIKGDTAELENLIEQRKQLEIKAVEDARDAKIAAEKEANAKRFETMRAALQKEAELLLAQEGITEAQKLEIQQKFAEESDKIDEIELQAIETTKAKEMLIRKEAKNEITDIENETSDEIIEIKNELNDAILASIEEQAAAEEAAREKELEALAEDMARRKEIIDALTKYAVAASDARIKQIDKEISAAQKQADYYATLAAEGNISAKESLAEQNKIIAEANEAKRKEEERKQNILKISAFLNAYNSNLAAGDDSTTAFTKAAVDMALVNSFIADLPSFFEGTEDTGAQGRGVDGRGGFHAILHPNERVVPEEINSQLEGIPNEDLPKLLEERRVGKMVSAYSMDIGKGNKDVVNELLGVKDELRDVRKAIENKPEHGFDVGKLHSGAMAIREHKKKGNRKTTTTFIID